MIELETDNVIALCHIIGEFYEFKKRLAPMLSQRSDFKYQLAIVSRGKNQVVSDSVYEFYRENKLIIDTINKYSEITRFINSCFCFDGDETVSMQNAYMYVLSHADEKEKILAVLEKLKRLGFDKFEFHEDYDPSKEMYTIHRTFRLNSQFDYVDNVQHLLITNYIIGYYTTGSNYSMTLKNTKEGNLRGSKIFLNSLVFDPKRLPERLNKENTFDRILNPKEQINEETHDINSDDLSKCFIDLEDQINSSIMIINGLDVAKDKDKLIEITANIRNNIEKLKTLCEEKNGCALEKSTSSQATLEKKK